MAQYTLTIANGTVLEEKGHFFKALPFSIVTSRERFEIKFERGEKNSVVFKIISQKKVLAECHHPDYIPEFNGDPTRNATNGVPPPESIPELFHPIMQAFAYLAITPTKDYLAYFHPITGTHKTQHSLQIIQTISTKTIISY
ncbi:hypothetical protein COTS27_01432 [Spirochaetota bacterium]|nr:hypothetical protein COTS27_01432 [Spirochaetota bacterium]